MAHPVYGVGLLNQTPLLLVVASIGDGYARVVFSDVTGETTGAPAYTATHPTFSRAITAGASYTTVTPDTISAIGPSSFEGRHTYGTPPSYGAGVGSWPIAVRNGVSIRTRFPEGNGPVIPSSCALALSAGATGNFQWSATVHFEEL